LIKSEGFLDMLWSVLGDIPALPEAVAEIREPKLYLRIFYIYRTVSFSTYYVETTVFVVQAPV
jgi:hypothetical protein